MNIKQVVYDRDRAFIDFVETGSTKKVRAYCRKYGVQMPKDKKVFAAGIYKAVCATTSIPQEIKDKAFTKCLELGFSPMINFEVEMIAIDMKMPENCARCIFRSISSVLLKETFVCYATLPRRQLAEATPNERLRFKPSWCPLIDLTDDGK